MVQVGDWVRIHEDADGAGYPIPTGPVRVRSLGNNANSAGSIFADSAEFCQEFFTAEEYDVVPAPDNAQVHGNDDVVNLLSDPGVRKGSYGSVSISIPASEPDLVNEPPHYKIKGDMEVIDVIEALAKDDAWYANAIKYLLRAKKKGKLTEDLGKCKFYIDRMLRDAESEAK